MRLRFDLASEVVALGITTYGAEYQKFIRRILENAIP